MKLTCYYTVLQDDEDNYALGVLFEHEDFNIYGMRKFGKFGSSYYVDSTYLEDINNHWNEYSKLLNKTIINVPRDNDDPLLKTNSEMDNAMLIPWEFVSEFETSKVGIFFAKLIYQSLSELTNDEFEQLKQDMNDDEN